MECKAKSVVMAYQFKKQPTFNCISKRFNKIVHSKSPYNGSPYSSWLLRQQVHLHCLNHVCNEQATRTITAPFSDGFLISVLCSNVAPKTGEEKLIHEAEEKKISAQFIS